MNRNEILFRRHVRLKDFDYRRSLAYFVTICVRNRECVFGDAVGDVVRLTNWGLIARDCWLDIPNHHPHVDLGSFIIMPNHVHGIYLFVGDIPGYDPVGATPASRHSAIANTSQLPTGPKPGSLGAVVGSYNAAVSRKINQIRPGAGTGLWQPNYYDHIIRNDYSHERIDDYIVTNPLRWAQDAENPRGDGSDDLLAFLRTVEDVSPLRGERDAGVAPTGEAP